MKLLGGPHIFVLRLEFMKNIFEGMLPLNELFIDDPLLSLLFLLHDQRPLFLYLIIPVGPLFIKRGGRSLESIIRSIQLQVIGRVPLKILCWAQI